MKYDILFCFVVLFLVYGLPPLLKLVDSIYNPNYSITEVCKHPEEEKIIRVLESVAGCETTVVECGTCGQQLTQPKTEC